MKLKLHGADVSVPTFTPSKMRSTDEIVGSFDGKVMTSFPTIIDTGSDEVSMSSVMLESAVAQATLLGSDLLLSLTTALTVKQY